MTRAAPLVLLAAGIMVALAATCAAQPTPLPDNITIATPDPSIPAPIAAFLGKWVGTWDAGLASTVVVRKIAPTKSDGVYTADVIYSWGTFPSWGILRADYRQYEAEIKLGVLSFRPGMSAASFGFAEGDATSLKGEFRNRGGTTQGTFRKSDH